MSTLLPSSAIASSCARTYRKNGACEVAAKYRSSRRKVGDEWLGGHDERAHLQPLRQCCDGEAVGCAAGVGQMGYRREAAGGVAEAIIGGVVGLAFKFV